MLNKAGIPFICPSPYRKRILMRTSRSALSLVSTIALASLLPTAALAQTAAAPAAAPPPPPDYTLTANVGIFSEYIFRGVSQTAGKPAVQGGFDWGHSSGFYLGTWGSNISWLEDFGAYTRSSLEWDFYGGYKNNFPGSEDFGYDVGTIYYYYPGSRNPGFANANTWELYAALNWKWLGAKASYSLDNYFGAKPVGKKTDGTWYFDFYANYPVGESGITLLGHFGVLNVANDGSGNSKASYNDWKLGASYGVPDGLFKGVEVGAYYSGNDAKNAFYTDLTGYNTAKDTVVVYVKKTF
jgi:uncharacterized protein (TIGR02001 family)